LATPLLYIETNFVMGHATGRDAKSGEILSTTHPRFRLIMPSVCVMEAFSAFEDERKRHNRLVGELEKEIGKYGRNVISPRISPLIEHLNRTIDELQEVFNDFWGRLYGAIGILRSEAELIGLDSEILGESLSRPLIDDPTDNLILISILSHAASHSSERKAFLSENRKDFDEKPYPREALKAAGVKYFAQASKFLEWHRSQSES
jgi:hypothetical protein